MSCEPKLRGQFHQGEYHAGQSSGGGFSWWKYSGLIVRRAKVPWVIVLGDFIGDNCSGSSCPSRSVRILHPLYTFNIVFVIF